MIDLSKHSFIQLNGPIWFWKQAQATEGILMPSTGRTLIPKDQILILTKENHLTKISLAKALDLGGFALKDEYYRTGRIIGYNVFWPKTYQTFWISNHTLKISDNHYRLF